MRQHEEREREAERERDEIQWKLLQLATQLKGCYIRIAWRTVSKRVRCARARCERGLHEHSVSFKTQMPLLVKDNKTTCSCVLVWLTTSDLFCPLSLCLHVSSAGNVSRVGGQSQRKPEGNGQLQQRQLAVGPNGRVR